VRYADAISINLLWQQQIFFLRENRNKEWKSWFNCRRASSPHFFAIIMPIILCSFNLQKKFYSVMRERISKKVWPKNKLIKFFIPLNIKTKPQLFCVVKVVYNFQINDTTWYSADE
jgi:hypothetical protein